ncbi:MAG TPA: hypothetical protein VH255_04740 [Verrucomicrobiae bacterium]|nr:hypothetical protein [Verrucomicrobiae bacterium]
MDVRTSKYFWRHGFGLFDLLCFIAACSLVYPLALAVSRHYEGHQRLVVFCLFMVIVYPILAFTFLILMHLYFRRLRRKRYGMANAPVVEKKPVDS